MLYGLNTILEIMEQILHSGQQIQAFIQEWLQGKMAVKVKERIRIEWDLSGPSN